MTVMIAENDPLHPFEVRGPKLRAALEKRGKPFVLFEETMPLKGHGAGYLTQFDQWYGACIFGFLSKPAVPPGETRCEGPAMAGRFAVPRDVKIAAPAPASPPELAGLSGRWSGTMTGDRGIMVIFETVEPKRVSFVYALDDGKERKMAPFYSRRTAEWNGKTLESRTPNMLFSIVLAPPGADGVLGVVITAETGTIFNASLRRENGS
jgi:hypothetical protein